MREIRGAQHRETWHNYFLILLTHYGQVVTSYLGRSGHQVSLNDLSSHHLFAALRRQRTVSEPD